ncbi:MAG: YciI family protein [Rhodanobacter sp.]
MKYRVMIYCNKRPLDAGPGGFDRRRRGRRLKAGMPRAQGLSLDSQQWVAAVTGCTVRVREGQTSAVDGLCAEATEFLVGSCQIEAADMDEAVLIASSSPWVRTGAIEIRALREIKLVRQRTGV